MYECHSFLTSVVFYLGTVSRGGILWSEDMDSLMAMLFCFPKGSPNWFSGGSRLISDPSLTSLPMSSTENTSMTRSPSCLTTFYCCPLHPMIWLFPPL